MKANEKYKWILFDADDTLFDYGAAEHCALKMTLEGFNINVSPEILQRYNQINGDLFRKLEKDLISSTELRTTRFEMLLSEFGLALDAKLLSRQYLGNLSKSARLFPNAIETVHDLAQHFKLAIVTNGLAEVQRARFNTSRIKGYFEDFIISEEIGATKPSNEFFKIAFEKIGNPQKCEVSIVGDSLTSDMKGGIDFGIDTCWYNPRKLPKPHDLEINYEIHEIAELLDIFIDRRTSQ